MSLQPQTQLCLQRNVQKTDPFTVLQSKQIYTQQHVNLRNKMKKKIKCIPEKGDLFISRPLTISHSAEMGEVQLWRMSTSASLSLSQVSTSPTSAQKVWSLVLTGNISNLFNQMSLFTTVNPALAP